MDSMNYILVCRSSFSRIFMFTFSDTRRWFHISKRYIRIHVSYTYHCNCIRQIFGRNYFKIIPHWWGLSVLISVEQIWNNFSETIFDSHHIVGNIRCFDLKRKPSHIRELLILSLYLFIFIQSHWFLVTACFLNMQRRFVNF